MEEQKMELYHLMKNRYLIGDLLKESEYSKVYRAYDAALDQEVVLKEFVPKDLYTKESDIEKFIQEAGRFFGVYEYRGAAEVTDIFREGEHAYMAMEYLSGQTLRQYLDSRKRRQITIEEAWKLLLPVLELVSWMHSIGLVHGGITMDRLIFGENGTLCLTGIGNCFLRSMELEDAGPWSDARSAAEILYECLTGKTKAQAGRFWNKSRVRPISSWAAVSSRVDRSICHEMQSEAGEGCFGLYALAEQLGMSGETLAVYLGAIQSVWGEKWLNLTERYQKKAAEMDKSLEFMTKKQRKTAVILLGSLLIAGGTALGYVHTHGRQIIEYQIQRNRRRYQKDPVFLLPAESKEAEEIWKAVQKEGTLDELSDAENPAYDVDPEFMETRDLAGNEGQGFDIQDTHLKKLAEEIWNVPLEEEGQSRECKVSHFGDKTAYLEICNQKDVKYECTKNGKEENIEIVSDRENGRVKSCTVTLSEEGIKKFLKEIFPQIVPETYFTESEMETVLARTAKDGYYEFSRHAKFHMTLWERSDPSDETVVRYQLDLEGYAPEINAEETKLAGSYARNSAEYKEFMDFVKKYAAKSEKEDLATIYYLEENAVRKWNQQSNVKLFGKTREDFIETLENQGVSLRLISEEDQFQVTDFGAGALETKFLRGQTFETETGDKVCMQYDIISQRICRINLISGEDKKSWSSSLAAEMTLALSDDCSKSQNVLEEEIRQTQQRMSDVTGSSVWGQAYMDLGWAVLTDYDITPQFVLIPCGMMDGRYYSTAKNCWPQNGED